MRNTLFCPIILQITLTEATMIETDTSDKTRRRAEPGRPSPDTAAPDRKRSRAPFGAPHAAGRACRRAAGQPPVTAHNAAAPTQLSPPRPRGSKQISWFFSRLISGPCKSCSQGLSIALVLWGHQHPFWRTLASQQAPCLVLSSP